MNNTKALHINDIINPIYKKVNILIEFILSNNNNIAFTIRYIREVEIKIFDFDRPEFNIRASGVIIVNIYSTYNIYKIFDGYR